MFDTIAAPAGVRILDRTRARTQHVAGLRVTRWAQFDLEERLPFQAMWYAVPPSGSTYQDCHPEAELSLVVSGTATVEALGGVVEVRQGEAFLLPAGEPHVVHNLSEDIDLVVFSAYWLPAGSAEVSEDGAR
jgi:mannose-6-phosphate isomerase-like protein (cupin superfamily)